MITPGHYFFPASRATPSGVFNWWRERPVRGLGVPPTSVSGCPKGYPRDIAARADHSPLKLFSMCATIFL